MNFAKKSDACFEKIGQMNNHFCCSHVYNLDNNNLGPLQCKQSSKSCVSSKGSLIKTFIFQTIENNPDLQDCSNIWKPYVQQNVELFGNCLSRTPQNSLLNTKTTISVSKFSTKKFSNKTGQIGNASLLVQTNYTKIEQKKVQSVKTSNGRNCYLFDSETKKFAAIDEVETIKELNNWQPRSDFEDTRIEESPVQTEDVETEVLDEEFDEDEQKELEEFIHEIIDEILNMVDNEVQNDLLKQSIIECCCCNCGLSIEYSIRQQFKKKRFYCDECGLANECVCSILEEFSEFMPCEECGLDECISSTSDGSCKQTICTECGLDNCICHTLDDVVPETKSEELCLCGCYVMDCICCSLRLYLSRSTEILEFSPKNVTAENASECNISYGCGCNIQGCVCLRFQADDEQMNDLCSPSCDLIDCTCKSPETMKDISLKDIICDNESIVDTKQETYDCKRFVNYYIKNQQNKLRYQLEKNQNLIDNQNGNYCAICGLFNCPCTILPNASLKSSSTTIIYDM